MGKQKVARLASLPMDYQKLCLKKEVALWEDGHRTNGKFGEYEWWYFDGIYKWRRVHVFLRS